jgi:hypothetical protein
MTGYYENQSKTALNSKFKFEKLKIGKPVSMPGKPVPKPINQSVDND